MAKKEGEKNLGGRPGSYKPEYCQIALDVLSTNYGVGREQVAAELSVTTQTLRNWRKQYPEFNHAMEVGLNKSKAELFNHALKRLVSTKNASYNTPLLNRILQSVFKDDESAAVEIEGWKEAKTIEEKSNLVLQKLGEGEITPDQADKFSTVLSKHVAITELAEVKARLAALESAK